MTTLFEDLRRSIARLEKENPESKLLQDFKRQLRGLEAANGRTAKEIYLNGIPAGPTDHLFSDPNQARSKSDKMGLPYSPLPKKSKTRLRKAIRSHKKQDEEGP